MSGPAPSPPRLAELYQRWRSEPREPLPAKVSLATAKRYVRELQSHLDEELRGSGFEHAESINELLRSSVVGILSAIEPSRWSEGWLAEQQRRADHEATGGRFLGFGAKPQGPRRIVELPEAEHPQVSVQTLQGKLRETLEAIDRLIAATRPAPVEPVHRPWAEDDGLLAVFQRLFEPWLDGSGDFAVERLTELENALSTRHGIRVIRYDKDTAELFKRAEDPQRDTGGPRTNVPAIVGRAGHVKYGEVYLPAETRGACLPREEHTVEDHAERRNPDD